MVIFYSCPTNSILKHADIYRDTRNKILSLGHSINRDWIDYSINVAKRGISGTPPQSLYKEVMSAILTADVVIFDATVKSMALGHQITFALEKSKPTLILRKRKKDKEVENIFIQGSESRLLNICDYQSFTDISKGLKSFLRKYEEKPRKRFNLVINGAQENYVSWAAFNYKKSKTEIIQDSINKASQNDGSYQKYLNKQS